MNFSFLKVLIVFTILFTLFSNISLVVAQSWLDPDFGNNGIVTTKLSEAGYDDYATASVMQTDGKVIVAGFSMRPIGNNDFNVDASLFRFNTDGSPDYSFGSEGRVMIDVSNNSDDEVSCMALQADGKILLGGTLGGLQEIFVTRLTSTGDVDQNFGDNGFFIYAPSAYDNQLQSIAVVGDGKILGANSPLGWSSHVQLFRLLSDGSLDSDFGNAGLLDLDVPFQGFHISMKVDGNQRILLADANTDANFSAARFSSDGTPDSTFGTDGIVTVAVDTFKQNVYALNFDNDGNIMLAGSVGGPDYSGTDLRIAIVRLLDDGTLDATFGNGGQVITEFLNFRSIATDIASFPNGKFVVSGSWNNAQASDGGFHVVGYHNNGVIDSLFGTDGYIQTHDDAELGTFNGLHIISSDNFLFTGDMFHGISQKDFFISKFNSLGVVSHGFGFNGQAWGNVSNEASSELANAVAIRTDGKIVTAGAVKNESSSDFLITVHKANGTADVSVGDSGVEHIVFGSGNFSASAVTTADDGSMVIAGHSDNESALIKLGTNGNYDWTFGDNATVLSNFGFDSSRIEQIKLQSDGKIVGCGEVWNGNNDYSLLVFRLLSNGTPDTSFADNGTFTYNVNPDASVEKLTDLELLSDGSVIAAGNVFDGQSDEKVLLKLSDSGIADNTFGNQGVVSYSTTSSNGRNRIVIQSDGKIVAADETDANDPSGDFEIHRFNTDGSIDNSFGTNGVSIQGHSDIGETNPDVGLLSDGRIAITGYYQSSDSADFVVLLLHPNGNPDNSFGEEGYAAVSQPGVAIYNNALAVQSDDKVVVVGYADDGVQQDQVIARFVPSVATGVSSVESSSPDLQVYPNPAADNLYITIHGSSNVTSSLHLSNAIGQQLKSFAVSGNESFVIARETFPAGIYFLKLTNDHNELLAVQKVIFR